MAQYKTGSVNTAAGSNVVMGLGTAWLANVTVGDLILIGSPAVPFTVASVASDTQLTLSANFPATHSDEDYVIIRDFTHGLGLPKLNQGDLRAAEIITRAFTLLDQAFTNNYILNLPSSDDLAEGTTNLFFTDARARAALSGVSPVTYNALTGAIGISENPTFKSVLANDLILDEPSLNVGNIWRFSGPMLNIEDDEHSAMIIPPLGKYLKIAAQQFQDVGDYGGFSVGHTNDGENVIDNFRVYIDDTGDTYVDLFDHTGASAISFDASVGSIFCNQLVMNTALDMSCGGTGAKTASEARSNLGLGSTSSPTFASLTLTSPLSVANGGTGSTTAAAARTALGLGTMATQTASSYPLKASAETVTAQWIFNSTSGTTLLRKWQTSSVQFIDNYASGYVGNDAITIKSTTAAHPVRYYLCPNGTITSGLNAKFELFDRDYTSSPGAYRGLTWYGTNASGVGSEWRISSNAYLSGDQVPIKVCMENAGIAEKVNMTFEVNGDATLGYRLVKSYYSSASMAATSGINVSKAVCEINQTATVTLTSTPSIVTSSATHGQVLVVVNTGTNTLTIQDNSALAGSCIKSKSGSSIALTAKTARSFYFDGTYWYEI